MMPCEEELLGLSSSGSSSLFQLFSFKHPGNINFQLKGLLDGNGPWESLGALGPFVVLKHL